MSSFSNASSLNSTTTSSNANMPPPFSQRPTKPCPIPHPTTTSKRPSNVPNKIFQVPLSLEAKAARTDRHLMDQQMICEEEQVMFYCELQTTPGR